jgi:hypothetical protein
MLSLIFSALLTPAFAESKTCVVAGMTCQNCVDMVTKSVCTDTFSSCQVRIKDKKKHEGEISLSTKDPGGTIDMKRIDAELDKLAYSIASCRSGPITPRR